MKSKKAPKKAPKKSMKVKKQKPLKAFGVRADEDKMVEAHFLKIDTGDVFRRALDRAILEQSGKCVTCGASRKKK